MQRLSPDRASGHGFLILSLSQSLVVALLLNLCIGLILDNFGFIIDDFDTVGEHCTAQHAIQSVCK